MTIPVRTNGAAELVEQAASVRRADMIGKRSEIESAIANLRAAAAETLVEEQTKAAQLLARQDALCGKVRHADVCAPLSGTVSAVHVKTVSAVVQAGTMLAEIVPSEANTSSARRSTRRTSPMCSRGRWPAFRWPHMIRRATAFDGRGPSRCLEYHAA